MDEQDTEVTAEAETEDTERGTEEVAAEPECMLVVHNTVRRVATRLLRAQSPGRHKFTQKIGGGEIVVRRRRPRAYPMSVILRNLEALKTAQAVGAVEIRDQHGGLVDLGSLRVVKGASLAPPPADTRPKFPPDSAANDKNPARPPLTSQNVLVPSEHSRGTVPDLLQPSKEEVAASNPPPPPEQPSEQGTEQPPEQGTSEQKEETAAADAPTKPDAAPEPPKVEQGESKRQESSKGKKSKKS